MTTRGRRNARTTTLVAMLAATVAIAGCTVDDTPDAATTGTAQTPDPRPVDFGVPTTPQAADKAYPPGDRTPQSLYDVAVRGKRIVAVGVENAFNRNQPLILTSDDGRSWVRRTIDATSLRTSDITETPRRVVATPKAFVATGTSSAGPVLWSSPDGARWTRQPTDRKTFRISDSIDAVASAPSGVLMVGTSNVGHGGSSNQLVLWSSPDGSRWTRRSGPTAGLTPKTAGLLSAGDLIAHGNLVLVSGGLDTWSGSDRTSTMQFWRSSNGGRTFTRAALTGDITEESDSYADGLTYHAGRFYALGQGAGADTRDDGSWDGIVLDGGPTGASWRTVAKPLALGTRDEDFPVTLVGVGSSWLAVLSRAATNDEVTVAVGRTWSTLVDIAHASMLGPGNQYVNDVVAVGTDAILVGGTDRSGTVEAAIWRFSGGKIEPITLPAEAKAGRPSAGVLGVVAAGSGTVAVGTVSDSPASWDLTAKGWQATILPGRKDGIDPSLSAVTSTRDGRVVAVGERRLTIGRRAGLWVRDSAGGWSQIDSPVFGGQARSSFGGPAAADVVATPRLWVMVGTRNDGMSHTDAWAVYSRDGKTWRDASGGRTIPGEPGASTRRVATSNLRGPAGGTAGMRTVIATAAGFAAGGQIYDGVDRPTIWLSSNGTDWSKVVRLPVPRGVRSTRVRHLRMVGRTLIATGSVERFGGDTEGGWVSWTSGDQGRTWQAGRSPALARASVSELVVVPGGVVALGAAGPATNVDAAAWFSRDGRSWQPVALPGDRVRGPGEQGLVSGVVRNGKLLVVARDVPPAGGGHYQLELDLPG